MAKTPAKEKTEKTTETIYKTLLADVEMKADRSATFRITTGAVDRDNDTISPAGWSLGAFLANPVILWAHDYGQPPIGRATSVTSDDKGLIAEIEFAPKGVYPLADTVYELVKAGFIRATSVGFRPIEAVRSSERDGIDFIRQELLETSCVPVPANSEALLIARSKGINIEPLQAWARKTLAWTSAAIVVDKGVSPKDVSLTKAPEGEAWSAPSLGDLLSGSWDDATDAQRRKVAGHFAWAAKVPPDTFGDCKLPHHRADGAIVFRGVVAATGRLNQASIPTADMGAVKAHLRRHYKAFGKSDDEIPDALKDIGYYSEKHTTLIGAMQDVLDAQLRRVDVSHVASSDIGHTA